MIKLKKLILFFASLLFTQLTANIDPFSKIKITSENAVCKKNDTLKNIFIFNYLGNVIVTLADGSKITAKTLEITLDGSGINIFDEKNANHKHKKNKNDPSEKVSHVKKIVFKNNVTITNQNRNARANSAEISISDNTCKLDGNVKIVQTKTKQKKDIPLNIESCGAVINLKTSEISLLGNSNEPVSTIIELSKEILNPGKNKPHE